MEDTEQGKSSRRFFLKKVGVGVGALSVAGIGGASLMKSNESSNGVQVDNSLGLVSDSDRVVA